MVGSHLLLEVELHSLSAWGSRGGDHEEHDRECRLAEAPHTPQLGPGAGEGGCIPLVLVRETGC